MVTKINSAGWPKTIKNSFGCSTNNPIMRRKKIYFIFKIYIGKCYCYVRLYLEDE